MRKISSTYIFPCNRPPLKNGILVCDDEGTVVEVIDTGGHLREQSGLEQYSGILVPGFVNAHSGLPDISLLKEQRAMGNTFFVLCPNASLYNENRLPAVALLRDEKLNICLGTDSLASNHDLSLLREMILLQEYFPEITLQELFEWGCLNGAKALQIDDRYGSFEAGKRPGVNLITGVDLHNLKLTSNSRVKVFQFKDT